MGMVSQWKINCSSELASSVWSVFVSRNMFEIMLVMHV